MVILPNNHIFNLKMRKIARILVTNDFKNENISAIENWRPVFEEINFLVAPPAPLKPIIGIIFR